LDRGREVLIARKPKSTMTMLAAALVAAACTSGPEAGGADAPRATDLRALRWLAPDADKAKALTTMPASCETEATGVEAGQRMLGKLAFESPALLGGAAARMGLSCSSCHLNGRGNPDFFLEGVSGKPGTADVTSSLLSKVRGDGDFNPVAIPDIALRSGTQIQDRQGAEFKAKVHGLIVEEFDGQDPPPPVFDAVVRYMDGLAPSACKAGEETMRPEDDLIAARSALESVSVPGADRSTGLFYLRVARLRLERIHERLPAPEDAVLRRDIVELSRALGEISEMSREGQQVVMIRPDWDDLLARLADAADRSFYNAEVLRAALATP
jgi:hypothetical protein